jgi:Ca-activated chloride channel family protein
MPKIAKVAFFFTVIAGFALARGQAVPPDANVPAVAASSAPAAADERPQVILNVLVDLKKGVTAPIPVSSLEIFEDGAQQKIESIAGPGSPVSLCLMIDISGSMTKYKDQIGEVAKELVRSLPQGSEVMVSTFAEKTHLVLPFTPATEVDLSNFGHEQQGLRTAMNDAIVITEPYFVSLARYPRRALVLISDGGDNASRHHTSDAIRSMEMPSSPFVYVLGISDPYAPTPEERMSVAKLDSFSSAGALIAKLSDVRDLLRAATEISECIDRQYALSYRSALTTPDKRLHKIQVKLPALDSNIRIESLPGYYIQSH